MTCQPPKPELSIPEYADRSELVCLLTRLLTYEKRAKYYRMKEMSREELEALVIKLIKRKVVSERRVKKMLDRICQITDAKARAASRVKSDCENAGRL